MSYDLLIFRPNSAPRNREEFMYWYNQQLEYTENHNYDDPKVSSEEMRNWFMEMILTFPALNGPYSVEDFDNPKVTDYTVGQDIIYACFAWSEAENAYSKMLELAKKHKVGFYDCSANDGIIFRPDELGDLMKTDYVNNKNSIEEIKGWRGDEKEPDNVGNIIFDSVIKQTTKQNSKETKLNWWDRIFKGKNR